MKLYTSTSNVITEIKKDAWLLILETRYFYLNGAFYKFICDELEKQGLDLFRFCQEDSDGVWFKESDLSFRTFAYYQMSFIRIISTGELDSHSITLMKFAKQ